MGAKHVLLVSVVVLLLTGATYFTISPHGYTVSFPGRKAFPGFKLVKNMVSEDNVQVEGTMDSTADSTVVGNVVEVVEPEQEGTSGIEIVGPTDATDFSIVIVELEALTAESVESETVSEDTSEGDQQWNQEGQTGAVQAEDNMDLFLEIQKNDGKVSQLQTATSTEETLVETRPQRVMLESDDSSTHAFIPDPNRRPQEFVSYLQNLDLKHRKVEAVIQKCIKEEGCGTVE